MDYTLVVCNDCSMTRAQVVIDDELLLMAKAMARRQGRSFSEIVREALGRWLAQQEPDTSWMGSLNVAPDVDDSWEAVQATIARGMAERGSSGNDSQ